MRPIRPGEREKTKIDKATEGVRKVFKERAGGGGRVAKVRKSDDFDLEKLSRTLAAQYNVRGLV